MQSINIALATVFLGGLSIDLVVFLGLKGFLLPLFELDANPRAKRRLDVR